MYCLRKKKKDVVFSIPFGQIFHFRHKSRILRQHQRHKSLPWVFFYKSVVSFPAAAQAYLSTFTNRKIPACTLLKTELQSP